MKYDDEEIVNMDETLLTLNMPPNYDIAKKNKKSIIIRTQNQEKWRLRDGNINKELNKNQNIKFGKILIAFNKNALCT